MIEDAGELRMSWGAIMGRRPHVCSVAVLYAVRVTGRGDASHTHLLAPPAGASSSLSSSFLLFFLLFLSFLSAFAFLLHAIKSVMND